ERHGVVGTRLDPGDAKGHRVSRPGARTGREVSGETSPCRADQKKRCRGADDQAKRQSYAQPTSPLRGLVRPDNTGRPGPCHGFETFTFAVLEFEPPQLSVGSRCA